MPFSTRRLPAAFWRCSSPSRRRRLTQTIGTAGRLIAGDAQVRTDIESTASDNRFAYAPAIAIGVVLVALSW